MPLWNFGGRGCSYQKYSLSVKYEDFYRHYFLHSALFLTLILELHYQISEELEIHACDFFSHSEKKKIELIKSSFKSLIKIPQASIVLIY